MIINSIMSKKKMILKVKFILLVEMNDIIIYGIYVLMVIIVEVLL